MLFDLPLLISQITFYNTNSSEIVLVKKISATLESDNVLSCSYFWGNFILYLVLCETWSENATWPPLKQGTLFFTKCIEVKYCNILNTKYT